MLGSRLSGTGQPAHPASNGGRAAGRRTGPSRAIPGFRLVSVRLAGFPSTPSIVRPIRGEQGRGRQDRRNDQERAGPRPYLGGNPPGHEAARSLQHLRVDIHAGDGQAVPGESLGEQAAYGPQAEICILWLTILGFCLLQDDLPSVSFSVERQMFSICLAD